MSTAGQAIRACDPVKGAAKHGRRPPTDGTNIQPQPGEEMATAITQQVRFQGTAKFMANNGDSNHDCMFFPIFPSPAQHEPSQQIKGV